MNHATIRVLTLLLPLLCLLGACRDEPDYENTKTDNIECLWTILDEHYCFFEEKGIDWDEVHDRYLREADTVKTYRQLFDLCARMVNELRDGHVNLASSFDVSYYRQWWTDYPQDFNLRTLQQYYLDFDWHSSAGMDYKILPSGIGYIYYPSFSYAIGHGNLDNILNYFQKCPALIIDVRDNGGGDMDNVHTLVGHFIDSEITGGYMRHKTGPAHDAFSPPYAVKYKSAGDAHTLWDKPVAVIANRSTFSAANDFVAVMKSLSGVVIAGARTGGGGGMPFTYDLPAGWTIRLSASPLLDSEYRDIEEGIDPTPGWAWTSPEAELAAGRDAILDNTVQALLDMTRQNERREISRHYK